LCQHDLPPISTKQLLNIIIVAMALSDFCYLIIFFHREHLIIKDEPNN